MVEENTDLVDTALKGIPLEIAEDLRSDLYIFLCEIADKYVDQEIDFRDYIKKEIQSIISNHNEKNINIDCLYKELDDIDYRIEDGCIYKVEYNRFYNQLSEREKIVLSRRENGYTLEEIANYLSDDVDGIYCILENIKKKYHELFNC